MQSRLLQSIIGLQHAANDGQYHLSYTCSMKINISERILPLLNMAANEQHLAKLQVFTASFTSHRSSVFLRFLTNFSHAASCVCKTKTYSSPSLISSLTWFTGERLGCVVTENNRHRVFFCLPRHPGNVLDVMELSDLKRKRRQHITNSQEQQQQQQRLNCHLALTLLKVQ